MSKRWYALVVTLAVCGFLLLRSATVVFAADEKKCTTQGALALALADVLGIKVTTVQGAASALTALGIKPTAGWDVEACLTDAVILEVAQAYALLNSDTGGYKRALEMVQPSIEQMYPRPEGPVVSPFKP